MKVNTDSVLLGCYTNPGNARNILDVGTGTGLLAIQLSSETSSPIVAIEIDHQAYEQACSNVAINHKEHQITVINEDFNKYNPSCKFDLIICNPPYFCANTVTDERCIHRDPSQICTTKFRDRGRRCRQNAPVAISLIAPECFCSPLQRNELLFRC